MTIESGTPCTGSKFLGPFSSFAWYMLRRQAVSTFWLFLATCPAFGYFYSKRTQIEGNKFLSLLNIRQSNFVVFAMSYLHFYFFITIAKRKKSFFSWWLHVCTLGEQGRNYLSSLPKCNLGDFDELTIWQTRLAQGRGGGKRERRSRQKFLARGHLLPLLPSLPNIQKGTETHQKQGIET